MNDVLLELALKKQRLQLRSAALRDELADHAQALEPLCEAGDRVREGFHWLGRHPEAVAGIVVALVVARPRAVLRWAQRGFFAWRLSGKLRGWLAGAKAA